MRKTIGAHALALILGMPLLAGGGTRALDRLDALRPDLDLVVGFERCPAAPELFARLQDEMLFGLSLEEHLPDLARLAGVQPGAAVEPLVLAVRGESTLAILPSTLEASQAPAAGAGAQAREVRRLDGDHLAVGDLSLLRDRGGTSTPSASTNLALPAGLGGEVPGSRCAWVVALPSWFAPEPPAILAEADVGGRSLLRTLAGIHSMTVTADIASALEIALRVHAATPGDAAEVADALGGFLAVRRANTDAPEAVRKALEQATLKQESEVVTLRLPLSGAALERIRHNQDSRTLLRLRFDEAERERWQRVAEIVRSMELREDSQVADVGAGDGFFSVRLARALGTRGSVWAVEIDEKAIARLSQRAVAGSLSNVRTILGAADDPRLPPGSLDAILIVNSYHEMPRFDAMLSRLFEALKPGGRLVLVEPWSESRRAEPRSAQVADHLIAPEIAEAELQRAGFEISARRDDFVQRKERAEWLILARRP